jgi:hypothetical protein
MRYLFVHGILFDFFPFVSPFRSLEKASSSLTNVLNDSSHKDSLVGSIGYPIALAVRINDVMHPNVPMVALNGD